MRKIYLTKGALDGAALQKLIDELKAQGVEVIASVFNDEEKDDKADTLSVVLDECDDVLVLIDENCDEDVDQEIETAVLCGKRPFGVYIGAAGEDHIPESLRKMGAGVFPCELNHVERVMQGAQTTWLTPQGQKIQAISSSAERSDC